MVSGIRRPMAMSALHIQTKADRVALENALSERKGKRLRRQAVFGAGQAAGIDQSALMHVQGQFWQTDKQRGE